MFQRVAAHQHRFPSLSVAATVRISAPSNSNMDQQATHDTAVELEALLISYAPAHDVAAALLKSLRPFLDKAKAGQVLQAVDRQRIPEGAPLTRRTPARYQDFRTRTPAFVWKWLAENRSV